MNARDGLAVPTTASEFVILVRDSLARSHRLLEEMAGIVGVEWSSDVSGMTGLLEALAEVLARDPALDTQMLVAALEGRRTSS